METCWDFIEWLGPDTSTSVLMSLADPADLVRVSSVSRSWRRFVIANGFSKKLCLTICPELSNLLHVTEVRSTVETAGAGSSSAAEWESLEREHRIYTYLSHRLLSPVGKRDCIVEAIGASSTDNYPDESIDNTLEPGERVDMNPSYWSSKGERDPSVPETLTYRLCSKLCVIDEIRIQPFRAFFQHGHPIYSAKAVRFKLGYSKLPQEEGKDNIAEYMTGQGSAESYVWTYVSPEFPMAQENILQSFKLPRPAVCIGGVVQIELLGRIQTQEMDGLYYICVCHVQVIGRPLSPVFDVDIRGAMGNLVLKYFPDARSCSTPPERVPPEEPRESSGWHAFAARIRQLGAGRGWNHALMSTLLGNTPFNDFIEDEVSDYEPNY